MERQSQSPVAPARPVKLTDEADKQYHSGDTVDGTYQLNDALGRGGMGIVFSCKHLVMKQTYAIKLLANEKMRRENWTRFQIEAKALARLNHPGIVTIYNMGVDQGRVPYYVMELLSGENLEDLIQKSGRLPVEEALKYFIKVAEAISVAHAQDIIHRDIKPSNIMLVRDEQNKVTGIKVVDFGIARLSTQSFSTQSQTATGLIFGTPFYMSPEQCQGKRVDHRSDIYSLGCALFEALTGAPPFRGDSAFHTFMMHQSTPAPRLEDRLPPGQKKQLSPSLEFCMAKLLNKDPDRRYQTMEQVKQDLERINKGQDIVGGNQDGSEQSTPGYDSRDEKKSNVKLFVGSAVTFCLVMAIIGGGAYFALSRKQPPRQPVPVATATVDIISTEAPIFSVVISEKTLKEEGCSDEEVKFLRTYDTYDTHKDQEQAEGIFRTFVEDAIRKGAYLRNKTGTAFVFPPRIIVGELRVGKTKPVAVSGTMFVPRGADICFYQNYCARERPELAKLFHPDDLTGLELVVNHPGETLQIIKGWKKLRHLSFFDSLTKAVPGWDNYDQSVLKPKDLVTLDSMTQLDSLGLCGPKISGRDIAQMSLIRKVSSLSLKSLNNIKPVLEILPELDNIHELWLNGSRIKDEDLEALTTMKNLESLRITRNKITPESLSYFQRMPRLKQLSLDRYWTPQEQAKFKAALPYVQFEPVLDHAYWKVFTDK